MNYSRFFLLVCVWAGVATVGYSGPQRPRPGDHRTAPAVGATAPDWRLKSVAGDTAALSDLRHQVVVLDFWAHWCGPCRTLEPLFDQLVREYRNRPVRFFTVSIWPEKGFDPQAYSKEHRMASTFLIGDDEVVNRYGIWGIPTYFVIDPAGKVSYSHMLLVVDAEALGKRLREAIDRALTEPSARESK